METFFLLIPLLLILVTLAYGVSQVLVRAWLDYRVRIAFLDRLERNPSMLGPQPDVAAAMSGLTTTSLPYQRQNYRTTGFVLAVIGMACLIAGRFLRSGELAVGIYLGGVFCVALGLVIALFGILVRVMTRTSKKSAAAPRG